MLMYPGSNLKSLKQIISPINICLISVHFFLIIVCNTEIVILVTTEVLNYKSDIFCSAVYKIIGAIFLGTNIHMHNKYCYEV